MIRLIFEGLVKRQGPISAVDGASLEVRPGELMCVLGSQGAGKTTLGRLIAGLDSPDDGEIYFDERVVHSLPPGERRVGFVFADLALWPSLSVSENVGFPLRVAGMASKERKARILESLTGLRIDSIADRRPAELSSSQAFRVALARATVTRPQLLILDEPLVHIEPRGREEVWEDVLRLRADLGATTLWLTRAVPEALAFAERLAVMDLGRILQVGTPQELYTQPVDVFVARLLGPTNLIQGQVDSNGSEQRREVVVRTPLGRLIARGIPLAPPQGTPVTISIRPESLSLGSSIPPEWNRFPATIERMLFKGEVRQILLRGPGDWPVTAVALQCHSQGFREGQSLTVSVSPDSVTLLPGKFAVSASS